MGLDLSYKQIFNGDEVLLGLAISQEDLNELEDKGLQFIEMGNDHYYLGSSLLAFLKGIEGKR